MGPPGPKGLVMVDGANEGSYISIISGSIHLQDGINSLFPRLDPLGRHPIFQKVSFLDSPTAFEWIAFQIIVL